MKRIFFVITLLMIGWAAQAVPAYPEKIKFQQPNRDISLTIYLKGDEKVHWAESEDGYSLLHSDDGSLFYAMSDANGDMVLSKYLATDIEARSDEVNNFLKTTPKHLHFSDMQVDAMLEIWKRIEDSKSGPKAMSDVIGNKKFLVILFGFQDYGFTYGKMAFKMLFNQVNYTTDGAKGSVHDYYYDVSGGLFSLHVDIAGPYIGSHNMAYYGDSDYGGQFFAREAVDSASKDVDFSEYDNDGDGYIDGLHIIFAGYGEEAGASSSAIWSHKSNLYNPPTYNNTVIDIYSCSPELRDNNGTGITRIGVICHELGHVFGAPDYYDTDYGSTGGEYPGLGAWDIMSAGSWNMNGISPAHHGPYTKIFLYRWATCDTLNGHDGVLTIEASERSSSDFHRVNTSTPGDFFLIENRQKIGWDKPLSGHGLLVYHVHPDAHGRNVRNNTHPQQLYLLSMTNDTFPNSNPSSYGTVNSSDTPYPRTVGRCDSLTNNSVPWFRPWSKAPNEVSFRNISDNPDNNKLYLIVNSGEPNPLNVMAGGISNQAIEINWERYGAYNTIVVQAGANGGFGTPTGRVNEGDTLDQGGIVIYKGTGANLIVYSLERGEEYCFKLYSNWHDTNYSDGVEVCASTMDCNGGEWNSEDFESTAEGELPDCWNGNWSVATLGGEKVLMCEGEGMKNVISKPITYSTTHNTVLKFRYSFAGNCNSENVLYVDYRKTPSSDWVEVLIEPWRFGMAMWNEAYVQLEDAGEYSLLRFSIMGSEGAQIAIDDVELTAGNLVYSTCDDNGSINPMGYSIVPEGGNLTFTISALTGYELEKITLDGTTVARSMYTIDSQGIATYTLSDIVTTHGVEATFVAKLNINNIETSLLKAWPNPTNKWISISYPSEAEAILYDMTGREIKRTAIVGGEATMNVEDILGGVYILRCGTAAVKIVKE